MEVIYKGLQIWRGNYASGRNEYQVITLALFVVRQVNSSLQFLCEATHWFKDIRENVSGCFSEHSVALYRVARTPDSWGTHIIKVNDPNIPQLLQYRSVVFLNISAILSVVSLPQQ